MSSNRAEKFTATDLTLNQIAELVNQVRPEWDIYDVRAILHAHAHQVDGADLAVAAIRCATNLDFRKPAAIGWRGPHWDDLVTRPPQLQHARRCRICGKREPDCYGQRPGRDDDHDFEPVPESVAQ